MLIDEYDYKVLKRVEKVTMTNYGITELLYKQYWIAHDDLIVLIEDLLAACEHLKEDDDE